MDGARIAARAPGEYLRNRAVRRRRAPTDASVRG